MSYKPQDLFVGVIDLFVVILPGSLLILGVLRIRFYYPDLPLPEGHFGPAAAGAAFIVGAYVLGHLLSLVGSQIEDRYYDLRVAANSEYWQEKDKTGLRPRVLTVLRDRYSIPSGEGTGGKVRRRALKAVRLADEVAAVALDRKDADRRFFRNVTVVLAVLTIGMLAREQLIEGLVWGVLFLVSSWRYLDQQKKFTREVFEYFVLVHARNEQDSTTARQPASEPTRTTEIERRFLVISDAWKDDLVGTTYRQGYLSTDPDRTVRVRLEGDDAMLTVKARKVEGEGAEFEYPIPVRQARQMLDRLCKPHVVEKTRYRIRHQGLTWEVDEFHGLNEGLVLAEVELEHRQQTFPKPPWAGEEITEDFRYANANLSERPFKQWSVSDRGT